jgi:predicted ATPase
MSKEGGQLIMLSGCSGGGKTSVLAELARRGFATFEEPGRRIVKEQLASGAEALPWRDLRAFVELSLAYSIRNLEAAARMDQPVFFDRGIVDAYNYFVQRNLPVPSRFAEAVKHYSYRREVFLFPPWKEIFENDAERRHDFNAAVEECESLSETYAGLNYEIVIVPKLSVAARADFVLETLG